MERFTALGRGTQIMLVSSVLLLIVSFFRWQEIEFDLGPLGEGSAGVNAWDDLGGILMGILTIVLIARIAARVAAVELPIPVSYMMTSAVLAFLILVIAVLKNLTDDYSTFWSYIGVALAVLIAVGAWLEVQAAGGIGQLKSEIPAMPSSQDTEATAAAPEAAPPPPPATTAPPMTHSPSEPPTTAPEAAGADAEPSAEPSDESQT
ncbi:MAG TPA: hypothetical protein VI540_05400 [Gaiellaceae bacterium]|nr:hypothetical protein [Gaiellaceae bacterium]